MPRFTLILAFSITLATGCSRYETDAGPPSPPSAPAAPAGGAPGATAPSLAQAAVASSRKIIRNADLAIEVDEPAKAEQQTIEATERAGGFVVSSEAHRFEGSSEQSKLSEVTMVLRVPSDGFATALGELRKLAKVVLTDKVTAQDVTEEYIDLEAELRARRALEAQFFDVLKQAKSVKDILEVQTQLGDVRTQIEKLEGRRRFLENQTALSTIQLRIDEHRPLLRSSAPSFRQSFRDAWADSQNFSASLVNAAIRSFGFLGPLLFLFGLPLFGLFVVSRRLRKRMGRAAS